MSSWSDDPSQVDSLTLLKNLEKFVEDRRHGLQQLPKPDWIETNLIGVKELIRRASQARPDGELVERIVVKFSDKAILKLDIDEDDPRLVAICDEMRQEIGAALSSERIAPQPDTERAQIVEAAARIAEKRAEERFQEYGVREPDTNACYYDGRAAELYEALDEECEAIATAIRALASLTPSKDNKNED